MIEKKSYAEIERVYIPSREVKFSTVPGDSEDMNFGGYGSYFNNIDSHGDRIVKGAFSDAMQSIKEKNDWPDMLLQHGGLGLISDDLTPIGIWTDISEDDKGALTLKALTLP